MCYSSAFKIRKHQLREKRHGKKSASMASTKGLWEVVSSYEHLLQPAAPSLLKILAERSRFFQVRVALIFLSQETKCEAAIPVQLSCQSLHQHGHLLPPAVLCAKCVDVPPPSCLPVLIKIADSKEAIEATRILIPDLGDATDSLESIDGKKLPTHPLPGVLVE